MTVTQAVSEGPFLQVTTLGREEGGLCPGNRWEVPPAWSCPTAFHSPSLTPVLMGTVLLVTHPTALCASWETCSLHPVNGGTATGTATDSEITAGGERGPDLVVALSAGFVQVSVCIVNVLAPVLLG